MAGRAAIRVLPVHPDQRDDAGAEPWDVELLAIGFAHEHDGERTTAAAVRTDWSADAECDLLAALADWCEQTAPEAVLTYDPGSHDVPLLRGRATVSGAVTGRKDLETRLNRALKDAPPRDVYAAASARWGEQSLQHACETAGVRFGAPDWPDADTDDPDRYHEIPSLGREFLDVKEAGRPVPALDEEVPGHATASASAILDLADQLTDE